MYKRLFSLTKKKDFDNVFKKGYSGFGKIIGVKSADNSLNHNRFGVIVSNKISKKAVERNKIKRQIKEIIRLRLEELKAGKDVVIITLPAILNKEYQEIKKQINFLFKKLRLFK